MGGVWMTEEKGTRKIILYEVREDEKKDIAKYAEELGVETIASKEVPTLDNADLAQGCFGVSFLGMGKIDAKLIDRYMELGVRCLSTRTIGYNHIDLEHAKAVGMKVCNAAYAPNGVADFTVMLMLMCLRQYKQALWRGQVNDFSLNGLMGREMKDLTVGIIGTGRIGAQVIRNLSGFGCRILACDLRRNPSVPESIPYVDQDEIFRESDMISLHMPLTRETRHMINKDTIAKMKDGVIIINCARGELADVEALIEGIESEKIGALGMDTVEGEEGIVHEDHRIDILKNRDWFYLHQFRNVVMTSHMAFYTDAAVQSMVRCGVEGLVRMDSCGTYATELV